MAQRWAGLKREIEKLRRELLPNPFDPTGSYPKPARVQLCTRAFLVLSHAEIETFLEDWAKHLAKACETIWQSSKRVSKPLAFLVSSVGEKVRGSTSISSANAQDSHQRFAEMITKLFIEFYTSIKDNHGVKELNVLRLFDPLGVPAAAYGATLLPNLESLGMIRGVHAHNSARSVPSVLDPESEYERINTDLKDLEAFDQWLVGYGRAIR
jgi:hypothetical protein